MQGLHRITEFQGYEDIVRNFWGLDELDAPLDENEIGEWFRAPVLMMDEIPEGNPLQDLGFDNETAGYVTIGEKEFKVFLLSGDGGFRSMLVKKIDYWTIMREDNTIEFV
jgi:hypothetical protein